MVAKKFPPKMPNQSASSPSYSISDIFSADHVKGVSDSSKSSSKCSQQRVDPTGSAVMVAETELSVSILARHPLHDLSYCGAKGAGNINIMTHKKNSSEESGNFTYDSRKPQAKLGQNLEQFSEFILEQSVANSSRKGPISDLTSSEATIFSTREDCHSPSDYSRARPKNIKDGIDYTAEGYNYPKRRDAILFRPGSKIYRAYVRLRRLGSSIRRRLAPAWQFIAQSKRANASVRFKRKKLTAKRGQPYVKRLYKSIRDAISNPVNNPYLGQLNGAMRVSAITEDVRAMAGIVKEQPNPAHPFHENTEICSLFSCCAKVQNDMTPVPASASPVALSESIPPPPPPHGKPSNASKFCPKIQEISNDPDGVDEFKKVLDSGPSLVDSPIVQTSQLVENHPPLSEVGVGLWKQYLSNVTALRIRLRQEIALFQVLAAGQAVPAFFNKSHCADRLATNQAVRSYSNRPAVISGGQSENEKLSDSKPWSVSHVMSQKACIVDTLAEVKSQKPYIPRKTTRGSLNTSLIECRTSDDESDTDYAYSLTLSVSAYSARACSKEGSSGYSASDLTYSNASDVEHFDENVDKFQQVLNRRSMLGEMLDYNSDGYDASTITSQTSEKTFDSTAMKRYGTILSIHGSFTNHVSRSSSRYSPVPNPLALTRSPGINSNLHLIS